MPNIFPKRESSNLIIVVSGVGSQDFSCLMSKDIPCLDLISKSQCFPLWNYNQQTNRTSDLLTPFEDLRTDGIKQDYVNQINSLLNSKSISHEDIFYFIYAVLHSPEYRKKFANNLQKGLPRIPFVNDAALFNEFVMLGRQLSHLHTEFDSLDMYPTAIAQGDLRLANIEDPKSFFRVEKMKFAKKGDKSTVIYNKNITIENIPLEAYEYVVNGKPALEWVMERQCVKTDKASGIVNDANDYANETMNNPAYPLELFQRVITVSLETMKIVKSLPKLDID